MRNIVLSALFVGVTLVACGSESTPPEGSDEDGGKAGSEDAGATSTACGDAAPLAVNPAQCPTFEQGCLDGAFECTSATLECFYERPGKDTSSCPTRSYLRCSNFGSAAEPDFRVSCGLVR